MLRAMVQTRRISAGSDADSSVSGGTCTGADDEVDETSDKTQAETWVEWLIRSTHIAKDFASRAKVTDWIEGHFIRKWRLAGQSLTNSWPTQPSSIISISG